MSSIQDFVHGHLIWTNCSLVAWTGLLLKILDTYTAKKELELLNPLLVFQLLLRACVMFWSDHKISAGDHRPVTFLNPALDVPIVSCWKKHMRLNHITGLGLVCAGPDGLFLGLDIINLEACIEVGSESIYKWHSLQTIQ